MPRVEDVSTRTPSPSNPIVNSTWTLKQPRSRRNKHKQRVENYASVPVPSWSRSTSQQGQEAWEKLIHDSETESGLHWTITLDSSLAPRGNTAADCKKKKIPFSVKVGGQMIREGTTYKRGININKGCKKRNCKWALFTIELLLNAVLITHNHINTQYTSLNKLRWQKARGHRKIFPEILHFAWRFEKDICMHDSLSGKNICHQNAVHKLVRTLSRIVGWAAGIHTFILSVG
jgi:hypothetical protein